ncbi:dTDP-glucose 4,6-dehydratase [Heyndrickxia coagulans]|uniref:dTDP-glucose 4,6-dehydratase n=1 Tax=Heyndrickxia coagulans TaxID=1398 RepID=UPI00077962ED|nr:dTDP-glucose 4,6-dehydratase [Heyndrickxia coagulans]KYC63272.1 dTDP-glucose 4,6-dehydratase [Heyndrickxia coagulans]MBF8418097.1 dTDP-glucose 4,6-dehydratase [Heyndrickxia coagulans]UZH05011.1 dTDP-glucose 4,6-dehydratase [Heyndrickxia coagulans]
MSKKKVLVTGGAGFIGGNFVQYMVNKYPEYDIYNLDLLTYAGDLTKHREIENKENYHFVKADIADRNTILPLFEKEQFDYVVHFAAESHVDRSITEPEIFVRTNVLGTQVLLDAAKQIGIKKFLHVSTDEVYGELDFDPTTFFTEETPLQPNSPYSASKASSDLLVRAYHETFGLPINITRCSNNYGPYHFPEKLIPLTISRVLNDQKVPVYGNGGNIRDWLHVHDHCAAIDLVLHQGEVGEIYNVGGHNERTNLEVVKTIIKALGKSEDLIEFVQDRLGHDKRYAIDPTKLEKLGWKPTYTFETGIAQTIQWYLDHKDWWERIISGEYKKYFEKQYSLSKE